MSSTRSRMNIALSAKIRGKNSLVSSPDKVDAALSRYAYIKPGVENIIRCLRVYLVANYHESEASVSLGKSILDMYGEADEGRSAAAVFYATRSDSYTENIRTGLVVGVLQGKLNKWQKELKGLDEYVARFQKVRLRYNHYVNKVSDLEHHLDECENKKKDNSSAINSAKFKLIRNIEKLNDVEEEYSAAAEECCENLNKTWSERLDVLRDILSQLAGFLVLVHGRELTLDMGLIQLLGASAGRRWIQSSSRVLTPSIPVQTFIHKAGVLRRKQFLKAKVYCRLVGGLLEIYTYVDGPCVVHGNHYDKDSRCQHDLLLSPPKEKHSVKYAELLKAEQGGEPGGLTTGLNVHVDDSHMELIFYASSPNEAQAWVDAFHRAANWDQNACQHEQEKFQKDIESRNEEITKLLPHSLPEIVGVMGVAEVIERLPPPSPGIPPSLTEEMGMEVSSKNTTADECEMSISTAPPNLGRHRATNLGLNKTTSSTTGKGEKRRPLSVTLPLPLSPLSQSSDGFQLPPDGISQHYTVGGENASSEKFDCTKESSKGVMKMLSKKFAKNRRKSLQQGSFGSAILSPGYTPYTSTDGSRSSPVFNSLDSRYSASNASDSEASGLSSEKHKSLPTIASTSLSTVPREDLERFKSTNDVDLSLSVESLLDWDELQDLIKEGWICEKEVKDVWKECVTVDGGRLESFIRFIKLMDEKRFVHEIAANHGVMEEYTPKGAEEWLRRRILRNPNNGRHHRWMGALLGASGNRVKAILHLRRAISLDSNDVDAYVDLAYLLHAEGRLENASTALQIALRIQPNHIIGHANMSAICFAQGKYTCAEEHAIIASRLKPSDIRLKQNLAIIRSELGKASAAVLASRDASQLVQLETVQRASSSTREEANRVRTRLALGLVEMGNLEEAISVTKVDRIATGKQSILDTSYKTYEILTRAGLMPELI